MSGPQRTALISSMAVMMLFSIFGNVTLISSIWRTPRLHTRTNYFIFNLACADLGVTLLCMPFSLVTCYMQRWIFGNVMCQINGFMNILFAATSLLTLTAISIEKYFSIVRAMDHAITTRRTKYMLLCTWIVPGLLAAIPLARFTSYELNPGELRGNNDVKSHQPITMLHKSKSKYSWLRIHLIVRPQQAIKTFTYSVCARFKIPTCSIWKRPSSIFWPSFARVVRRDSWTEHERLFLFLTVLFGCWLAGQTKALITWL